MRVAWRAALALMVVLVPVRARAQAGGNDAETRFNTGLTHLRENRPALALEEFKRAVKQDAKNPYFYKGLGLAYLQLQKYPEAVEALRKSLEINPYYVDVRNDLGTALLLSGKRAEGKAELLTAFNDPTNPTPDMTARNLAQAYYEEKDYEQASNWFRSSLGRNKALPDSYLGLADTQLALKRPDEAIATLEGGLKQVPGHAGMLLGLGELYLRAGRLSEARSRFEEAMRREPASPAGKQAAERLKSIPK